ncbi:hypothetical protein [Curtobacterium sp. L1-20]|uniref:hypothetical protein n=1 Tax=Curtobacterium sp. L1-20 TaxID=3138181 RepID=UPI003B522C87
MMRTRSTATELEATRAAIHSAAAAHHPEDAARGRQAVEDHPDQLNHSRAVAEQRIRDRQERIALDDADIDARIQHRREGHTGPEEWTYELMHRAAQTGREVAYWEGVRDAARR